MESWCFMNVADELAKLEALRANGALTEFEYAQAKAMVLSGAPPGSVAGLEGRENPLGDANVLRKFTRSTRDRMLGGVCGGLGAQTPVPSWVWRVGFCLMGLAYGFGLIPYVLLWMFVPTDESVGQQS